MQAKLISGDPRMVDYTPSGADVAAGQVVVVGDSLFIAHKKIVDGELGALAAYGGVYEVTAGEAINAGKKVYWDDAANKVVETATGNKLFGFLLPGETASGNGATVKAVHLPDMSASTPAANVAALMDNSGGAADGTIAAITQAANAGSADVGPVKDAIADLAAKINAVLTALQNAGLMATS